MAGDVHDDGADQQPPATIYWPAQPDEQFWAPWISVARVSVAIARTRRHGSLLDEVHQAVWAVSADLPLAQCARWRGVRPVDGSHADLCDGVLAIAGVMALLSDYRDYAV